MTLPHDHTAMQLARALQSAGLHTLAGRAARGEFHDYLSPLAFPELELMAELQAAVEGGNVAAVGILHRHERGEFDASKEESDAWAASADGQAAFASLVRGKP